MPYWHLECSISYVMAVARIAWSKEQIADCDVAKTRERFFRNLLQYGHYIRVSTFLRASVAETCIVRSSQCKKPCIAPAASGGFRLSPI